MKTTLACILFLLGGPITAAADRAPAVEFQIAGTPSGGLAVCSGVPIATVEGGLALPGSGKLLRPRQHGFGPGLSCAADGALYAIRNTTLVRVVSPSSSSEQVIAELPWPARIAAGTSGSIFLHAKGELWRWTQGTGPEPWCPSVGPGGPVAALDDTTVVLASGEDLVVCRGRGHRDVVARIPGIDGLAVAPGGMLYVSTRGGIALWGATDRPPRIIAAGLHGLLVRGNSGLYVLSIDRNAVIRIDTSALEAQVGASLSRRTFAHVLEEARSALRRGALDRAVRAASEAGSLDPTSHEPWRIAAEAHLGVGNHELAAAALASALERAPEPAHAELQALARRANDEGRKRQLVTEAEKALEVDDLVRAQAKLLEALTFSADGKLALRAAAVALLAKQPERALEILRRPGLDMTLAQRSEASHLQRTHRELRELVGNEKLAAQSARLGAELLAGGLPQLALAELELANTVRATPQTAAGLARAYWKLGRLRESEKQLRLGLALDANHPALLATMADLHMSARRWAEAEEAYRRAAVKDPANPQLRVGIAGALLMKGDEEAARAALQTVPGDSWVRRGLGEAGAPEDARSSDPAAVLAEGRAALVRGDPYRALGIARESKRRFERSWQPHALEGAALEMLGQLPQAANALHEALVRSPSSQEKMLKVAWHRALKRARHWQAVEQSLAALDRGETKEACELVAAAWRRGDMSAAEALVAVRSFAGIDEYAPAVELANEILQKRTDPAAKKLAQQLEPIRAAQAHARAAHTAPVPAGPELQDDVGPRLQAAYRALKRSDEQARDLQRRAEERADKIREMLADADEAEHEAVQAENAAVEFERQKDQAIRLGSSAAAGIAAAAEAGARILATKRRKDAERLRREAEELKYEEL